MKPKFKKNDLIPFMDLPPEAMEYISKRISPDTFNGFVTVDGIQKAEEDSDDMYVLTWPAGKGHLEAYSIECSCSYVDSYTDCSEYERSEIFNNPESTMTETEKAQFRLECLREAVKLILHEGGRGIGRDLDEQRALHITDDFANYVIRNKPKKSYGAIT